MQYPESIRGWVHESYGRREFRRIDASQDRPQATAGLSLCPSSLRLLLQRLARVRLCNERIRFRKGQSALNRNGITSLEVAREALDALGLKYKYQNGGILCQCPVHEDRNASCSIAPGTGGEQRVVVKCFAGCDWRDIKQALESARGIRGGFSYASMNSPAPVGPPAQAKAATKPDIDHGRRVEEARYAYRLENGTVAFTKIRYGFPASPKPSHKSFSFTRRDQSLLKQLKAEGALPVYNLPELKGCIASGRAVMAGEGEKDCETAKKNGRTMICGHAGAGQRLPEEYAEQIRGLRLLAIIPDRDEPGTKYALNWMELARKADVPFRVLRTPVEVKGADLTDHFEAGHGWDDLLDVTDEFVILESRTSAAPLEVAPVVEAAPVEEVAPPTEVVTLSECEAVYRKWMSPAYDMSVVHANLAVRAAHELEGEPVWLLTVAGSASGKTEGIAPLAATPNAVMVSEIASPGALLSGTSNSERSKDASGGLLNQIGPSGFVILKDFTSLLSLGSDARTVILAAMREIYDGSWNRLVGTDGGKTLSWTGRISLIGATTTTYDRHHSVIAAMGDRFALIRMDSRADRRLKGRQALMNTGHEKQMRDELSKAAAGVIAGMEKNPAPLDDDELTVLFEAADYVTMARTPAERDFKGEPIEANDPESPARFVKMLQQVVLGGSAIGMRRQDAMLLALRIAHDSIPPVRRMVLEAIHRKPFSRTADVVEETQFPRSTIDRMLQELALQRLLDKSQGLRHDGTEGGRWQYCLAAGVDPNAVTPAALTGKDYPETSEGGAAEMAEAILLNEDIHFSSVGTEISGHFNGEAFDTSKEAPTDFLLPRSANVQTLFPIDDIEADTCDEHLVAPLKVIQHCAACKDVRGADAA